MNLKCQKILFLLKILTFKLNDLFTNNGQKEVDQLINYV